MLGIAIGSILGEVYFVSKFGTFKTEKKWGNQWKMIYLFIWQIFIELPLFKNVYHMATTLKKLTSKWEANNNWIIQINIQKRKHKIQWE